MYVKACIGLVDVATELALRGSRGHKVVLPKDVVKKELAQMFRFGNVLSEDNQTPIGDIKMIYLEGNQIIIIANLYDTVWSGVRNTLLGYLIEDVAIVDTNAELWVVKECKLAGAAAMPAEARTYETQFIEKIEEPHGISDIATKSASSI